MSNSATNVTVGKPKVGGAVFVGATTLTMPNDATSELASGFTGLGYCSEDGATNQTSRESEKIKAWGGDTVASPQTSFEDTFKFTLIETLNIDVLKEVYGASHVKGTLETGITVDVNSEELSARAWVIDTVATDNALKRMVIPYGKITNIGEISYKDNQAVGYEVTITATPDGSGNTHHEYIKRATADVSNS